MRSRTLWFLAVLAVIAGLALIYSADQLDGGWGRAATILGFGLCAAPAVAANIAAGRRRAALGEDSRDSVEFHAAQRARSGAFGDVLVIGALLLLALAVVPGAQPVLWGFAFLVAVVAAFWVRYRLELGRLRG